MIGGSKSFTLSKQNSTTRSLDSRSTSEDRDEIRGLDMRIQRSGVLFARLPQLRSGRSRGRAKDSKYDDELNIETVMEEPEKEGLTSEGCKFKSTLVLFEDRQDRLPRRRTQGFMDRVLRSRSTEHDMLPRVTESKEEHLIDFQQKMVFSHKLNTLVDLSEYRPVEGHSQKSKRNSMMMVAPDCLTIEEEEAENTGLDRVDMLSNDNESSKISSPVSKSLSKKHFIVDELSVDGDEKKRKRFESDVGMSDTDRSHHGGRRRDRSANGAAGRSAQDQAKSQK